MYEACLSTLAEAWAALADYKSYSERAWEGAERAFRRANELNPTLVMNHCHYAWYLVLFGRVDEAIAEQYPENATALYVLGESMVWPASKPRSGTVTRRSAGSPSIRPTPGSDGQRGIPHSGR